MFKPEEVAEMFSVKKNRVYEWVHSGKIRAIRIGSKTIRIPREAIIEFVSSNGNGFAVATKSTVTYRMVYAMRHRISMIFRGKVKPQTTMDFVGCSREQLIEHISNQFTDGMSWDNYGEWNIDHIIPCARFDLSRPDHQKMCFHYTNLQPLWKRDNSRKGKIVTRRNIARFLSNYHKVS
jgi:excisionase family DNA binding protein